MEKMKELYEKVAGDSDLQVKFAVIMRDADTAGKAATQEKLIVFAKEAGFDASFEEIREFFLKQSERELTDAELDMAAGGKGGFHFTLFGPNSSLSNLIGKATDLGNTPIVNYFK